MLSTLHNHVGGMYFSYKALTDAGNPGLAQGAGIISLLPEIADAMKEVGSGENLIVAAGGIVEGRGAAAWIVLEAYGVAMGARVWRAIKQQ